MVWWRSQPVQIIAGGIGGILIALPFIALLNAHRRQAALDRQVAEVAPLPDLDCERMQPPASDAPEVRSQRSDITDAPTTVPPFPRPPNT